MGLLTVSVEKMGRADRTATTRYGIPSILLMENAGSACARILLQRRSGRSGRVLVLAGEGNNGGDAYVVARHLLIAGCRVDVLCAAPPRADRADALLQRDILLRMGVRVGDGRSTRTIKTVFAEEGWIVDGLYGTGLTRPSAGAAADLIRRANASGRPILAIDVPSGLDATSGSPLGETVRARLTVTLAAAKPGLVASAARRYVGRLVVADIGLPRELLR